MSRLDHVERMIAELGGALSLPGLALDDSGRLSLTVGDAPVTILYRVQPVELVWIFVGLGELSDLDEAAMGFLLRSTGRLWAASGATIGLGEDGKQLLSRMQVPVAALDGNGLREALTTLLDASLPIRAALAAQGLAQLEGAQEASVPYSASPTHGIIRP